MSCTCEICQQPNLQGNVYNPNHSVVDREIANAMIDQNYYYQDLLNDVDNYQNQHGRSANNTRPTTIRYPSTSSRQVSARSVPTPSSGVSSSSTSLDYDSILLVHTEMIQKCQSDMSQLKMNFNFCKEILTKQLEINSILLSKSFRQ